MSDSPGSAITPSLAARAASVDPEVLLNALEAAGWSRSGGRTGLYVRFAWPAGSHQNQSLCVPLDRTAPECSSYTERVLTDLEGAVDIGRRAQAVLDALKCPAADPAGRTYLDNPPAAGAPAKWRWGYLACGCCNDGYGRHLR